MKPVNLGMILLMLIGLAACAGRDGKRLPLNHDLGPTSGQIETRIKLTLDAPVWLWDDKIRYRLLYRDASAIRYYHLDRWDAPLPALLERRLSRIESTRPLALRVALEQFEQRFKAPDDAQVLIELTVSAHCGADDKPLGNQRFSRSLATSADAAGAINGFSALTDQLRSAIQDWLLSLPEVKPCSAQSH